MANLFNKFIQLIQQIQFIGNSKTYRNGNNRNFRNSGNNNKYLDNNIYKNQVACKSILGILIFLNTNIR